MNTHVSVSTQQESTTVNMYIISNHDRYISALLRHSTAYRKSETKKQSHILQNKTKQTKHYQRG